MNKYECKCCQGQGIQTKLDGIKIYCPACKGTGESPFVNQNIKPENFPESVKESLKDNRMFC